VTSFLTSVFCKGFVNGLNKELFPLTHAMCDKNQYESMGNLVLMVLQVRYGKLMSVVIGKQIEEGFHVFSFEVTADCRLMDYGTKAMDYLKRQYRKIELHSLSESQVFYEKMGFRPTGESEYTWRS